MRRFFALVARPFTSIWGIVVVLAPLLLGWTRDLLMHYVNGVVIDRFRSYVETHHYAERGAQIASWGMAHPVRSMFMLALLIVAGSAVAAWAEIRRYSADHYVPPSRRLSGPQLEYLPIECRRLDEYADRTGVLLPVRNNITTYSGTALNVVAHLTYQPLIAEAPQPLHIHRGMWMERDWYNVFIGAGETLHLVIAMFNASGLVAPAVPSVRTESITQQTLRMMTGQPQAKEIGSYQLRWDGEWRIGIRIQGEGFVSYCTVLLRVENHAITGARVIGDNESNAQA